MREKSFLIDKVGLINFVFLASVFVSCSSSDKYDFKTASGNFQYAQKLEKNRDFEVAITYYKNVKNRFPYNPLAVESELKIADLLFKQDRFIESEGAYKVFKEFHPKHKKLDYVTYQLGVSLFSQASRSVDRDLSALQKALPFFDEVLQSFKESPYYAKALEKKKQCMDRLARRELYIAKFYFKQRFYNSALRRYEKLIRQYPNNDKHSTVLYGAMMSAYSIKEKDKFRKYYSDLVRGYPSSKEARRAKKKFSTLKE